MPRLGIRKLLARGLKVRLEVCLLQGKRVTRSLGVGERLRELVELRLCVGERGPGLDVGVALAGKLVLKTLNCGAERGNLGLRLTDRGCARG